MIGKYHNIRSIDHYDDTQIQLWLSVMLIQSFNLNFIFYIYIAIYQSINFFVLYAFSPRYWHLRLLNECLNSEHLKSRWEFLIVLHNWWEFPNS